MWVDFRLLLTFRKLSNNLEELKSEARYTLVFGVGFGRPYKKYDEAKKTNHRVGDCKAALVQFARFLSGVESSLAQHAALTRDHYEAKCQHQPKQGQIRYYYQMAGRRLKHSLTITRACRLP